MRDRLLYDIDEYKIFIHEKEIRSGIHPICSGDIVTIYSMANETVSRERYSRDNIEYSRVFLELAGEIYLLPRDQPINAVLPRTIKVGHYDENYMHIEYNGATRLTIEDAGYIYELIEPNYVDYKIRYEEHLFVITYRTCEKSHMIVLLKNGDYVELLNVTGDSIDIDDSSVNVVTYLHDSLGRVRHEIYEPDDTSYRLSKCYFEYTYTVHYDERLSSILLEDAIAARDYEYVARCMNTDVDVEDVSAYFEGILGKQRGTLSIENVTNTMHFVVDTPPGRVVKDINVYYDEVGKVTNFDGGDNAE